MDNIDNFISDEMLAAYIDGNAIPIERNIIEKFENNDNIQELIDITNNVKDYPELIEEIKEFKFEITDNSKIETPGSVLIELKQEIEQNNKKRII